MKDVVNTRDGFEIDASGQIRGRATFADDHEVILEDLDFAESASESRR